MKQISMKDVVGQIKDKEFQEHIDPMQFALFKEHKLPEKEKQKVFKHLAHCKRCRKVLRMASELEKEQTVKPINNPNYKDMLKHFAPFAAVLVIFVAVPQVDKYFNEVTFKGVMHEKNILEESIEYWENLFAKLFNNTLAKKSP